MQDEDDKNNFIINKLQEAFGKDENGNELVIPNRCIFIPEIKDLILIDEDLL